MFYPANNRRALVVDGDTDARNAVVHALKRSYDAVDAVDSALNAYYALQGMHYELLATDFRIANDSMNGVDLIVYASRNRKADKSIMISGTDKREVIKCAGTLNITEDDFNRMAAFLTKPFELAELNAVLTALDRAIVAPR